MAKNEKEEKEGIEGGIIARIIIEVLGAPKEHVEHTLQMVVDDIEKAGFRVLEKELFPAEPKDKLFTAFTEVEISFKNVDKLMGFCFDFLPSSVEITEPEHMSVESRNIAGLLNDMLARLHAVDMRIKQLMAENAVLENNTLLLIRNTVMLVLKDGGKTASEISDAIGIKSDQFTHVLDIWVNEGSLEKKEDKYFWSQRESKRQEPDGHEKTSQ